MGPDPREDVRSLMRKYGGNDELQSFLLRMVWLRQLEGAFPEAKAAALSGTASQYTRIAAIRAVKAVGGAVVGQPIVGRRRHRH